ncbi:glycosyl transferase group 1 [Candidatus Moduliflexus flocculans]|uniref:Glycosyl transferase group 1 n=1 Tax=Candidatus Moduliflexus flocculans TaxID=1499966 RepID=A0A0S6VQG2_9BACT|nr:glycosyl transferase group 1 [Candidatus Moduliflexus flocculans]
MKIGVEATSAAVTHKAGVGHYVYHLIQAMINAPNAAHQYTLYLRQADPRPLDTLGITPSGASEVAVRVLEFPLLWAQIRLPLELMRHPQDVYFFPSPTMPLWYLPKRSVVTIHDVAFLFFPDCFSPALRFWLKHSTQRSIRAAAKIITVSEATRQDVLAYYNIAPEKVIAVHHGVHQRFQPLERAVVQAARRRYRLPESFILCIGTLQRRKNIPRLIHAFYLLKQKHQIPHKLVLIGQQYRDLPEDEIFSMVTRLSLQQEVIWTGYVPDQDMPALINGAEAFVLPSLYEGFGMPVLEAMACGVPVACSNTSSLPEVAGNAAMLFDPYSVDNMAERLHQLLTDRDLRLAYREMGLMRAKQFSWEFCAQKTLDVLTSLV